MTYRYTGYRTRYYFKYLDLQTGHTLVAEPGCYYQIAATEYGPVPPADGFWAASPAPLALPPPEHPKLSFKSKAEPVPEPEPDPDPEPDLEPEMDSDEDLDTGVDKKDSVEDSEVNPLADKKNGSADSSKKAGE